jgi:diaminohydroxyphosphoribosylaminopyrimidine deaminase/5-amino-6-(5-phosphoribosylamino)uracil reductase
VLDTQLRFPAAYRWTDEGRRFLVITGPGPDAGKRQAIESNGGTVISCELEGGRVDIAEALKAVEDFGISSILVEGGAGVLTGFLQRGLWDGLTLFLSPKVFGPDGVELVRHRVDLDDAVLAGVTSVDPDACISYLNRNTGGAMAKRLTERR